VFYRRFTEHDPNNIRTKPLLLPLFFFVNPSSFKQIHPKNPETFYPRPKRSCSGIFSSIEEATVKKQTFCQAQISKFANQQIRKLANQLPKQLTDWLREPQPPERTKL